MDAHPEKMICPRCGAEMNRHALKEVWHVEEESCAAEMIELHCCPACGASSARRADH